MVDHAPSALRQIRLIGCLRVSTEDGEDLVLTGICQAEAFGFVLRLRSLVCEVQKILQSLLRGGVGCVLARFEALQPFAQLPVDEAGVALLKLSRKDRLEG